MHHLNLLRPFYCGACLPSGNAKNSAAARRVAQALAQKKQKHQQGEAGAEPSAARGSGKKATAQQKPAKAAKVRAAVATAVHCCCCCGLLPLVLLLMRSGGWGMGHQGKWKDTQKGWPSRDNQMDQSLAGWPPQSVCWC